MFSEFQGKSRSRHIVFHVIQVICLLSVFWMGLVAMTATRRNGDGVQLGPAPDPHLFPTPAFAINGSTHSAAGDFNSDEHLDVATAGKAVTVWLGAGDGTFHNQWTFAIAGTANGLAVAMLNADAFPDLVVTSTDAIYLLTGRGDGTFQLRRRIDNENTGGMTAADFNGDGRDDFATIHTVEPKLRIWINSGDADFPAAVGQETRSNDSIINGDLNNDGHVDLILHRPELFARNVVYLGVGDGSFQGPQLYRSVFVWADLHLADANNDGNLDLFLHDTTDDRLFIFAGVGDGSLAETIMTTVDNLESLIVADMNSDGNPDVVGDFKVSQLATEVGVLVNDGGGGFPEENLPLESLGPNARPLESGDFNGDGFMDVLLGTGAVIWSELGKGDGTFQQYEASATLSEEAPQPLEMQPIGLAIGEINGDGVLDVAAMLSNGVSILLRNVSGALSSVGTLATGRGPRQAVMDDLDGDGDMDLATANMGDDDVSVLRGRGDGTFLPEVRFGVGVAPRSIAVGDMDGDGVPDLVVGNTRNEWSEWTGGVSVLRGVGDATFYPDNLIAASLSVLSMAVADMDADGDLDIVTGTRRKAPDNSSARLGDIALLRNNGDGTFGDPEVIDSPGSVEVVRVVNVDDDDLPDITALVSTSSVIPRPASRLHVLLGRENGYFAAPGSPPSSMIRHGSLMVVEDLDGDGNADIAMASSDGHVAVRLGSATGSFGHIGQYRTKADVFGFLIADFDGDGDRDLMSGGDGRLWILWASP